MLKNVQNLKIEKSQSKNIFTPIFLPTTTN